MKRLLPLLLLAVVAGGVALAQSVPLPHSQVLTVSYQAGTGNLPDSGFSAGMIPLYRVTSIHPSVQCPNLGNVTAGSLIPEYCTANANSGTWEGTLCMPMPTMFNCALPTGGPNALCPDQQVVQPWGYIGWFTSGVTCGTDGGSSVVWDGGVAVILETSLQQ